MSKTESKIKILQIIPSLDRSGAEKQLVLLAKNLPKEEFDVEIAVLTRSGPLAEELDAGKIPWTLIGKRWKVDPFAFGRLKRLIRRFRPEIVQTWLFAANSYGRQAALACGVKHLIASERCVDPWKSWYHFMIDRRLVLHTDRIATNSVGVKEFYVEHGLPAEKFAIIPNAVVPAPPVKPYSVSEILDGLTDLSAEPTGDYYPVLNPEYDSQILKFVPLAPTALARRTPFLIGIVARLWPQKRIKDVLWVFETLKYVNLNFHALIIGDGPERDTLLRFRDQWGLADRVHFLGHRNDVDKIMPSFDLMLSCSEYEGQSNSILEAMSLGVPVIATDIPGNRDLVLDGKTGLLVPDCGDDFRQRRRLFVEKTLSLLENEELRKKMGQESRHRIETEFSLDQMVRKYADLYRELVRRKTTNEPGA